MKQCYYINTIALWLQEATSWGVTLSHSGTWFTVTSQGWTCFSNTLFHPSALLPSSLSFSFPPFTDTQVSHLILGLEISLFDMSWGWFSPRPPAQLSVHVTSRGEMFSFIKKCEYKKKWREGGKEWDTHAQKKKVQWQRPLTYICPICTRGDAALHEPGAEVRLFEL